MVSEALLTLPCVLSLIDDDVRLPFSLCRKGSTYKYSLSGSAATGNSCTGQKAGAKMLYLQNGQ